MAIESLLILQVSNIYKRRSPLWYGSRSHRSNDQIGLHQIVALTSSSRFERNINALILVDLVAGTAPLVIT